MGLHVYNTLTGQKEPFTPMNPGKVTMYACGVTVYDYCHIGHARSAMVFDVIRNYLEYKGFSVTYVKNFTDVDDKIIKRALQEGIPAKDVAKKYIAAHDEDMAKLGIRPPTIAPKATAHIAEMIQVIQTLIAKGMAYPVDGDVYFAVKKFPGYGKLSGRNVDDLRSGARIDVDERKHDPLDFALWKASKPGEPEWESPWGKGRPGWHIECSAMSCKYLGDTFDIHGGGNDLIFPHHENEIAQSEAYTGKPFANYWLHNGMVRINQEKMSKSLGNFSTIRDILTKYQPEVVRFLMLSTHYSSPLEYSDARLDETQTALKRIVHALQDVKQLETRAQAGDADAPELAGLADRLVQHRQAFEAAMDDDFNTAAAIGVLFEIVKEINAAVRVLAKQAAISPRMAAPVLEAAKTLNTLGGVLGFHFAEQEAASDASRQLIGQLMTLILQWRKEARAAKNWAFADQIRNGLAQLGIQVKDLPDGATAWTKES